MKEELIKKRDELNSVIDEKNGKVASERKAIKRMHADMNERVNAMRRVEMEVEDLSEARAEINKQIEAIEVEETRVAKEKAEAEAAKKAEETAEAGT